MPLFFLFCECIMFSMQFSKQAARSLEGMPRNSARKIREKLILLAANPYAPNNNVKKLENCSEYRLRVGDWRVIYAVIDKELVIEVIRIRHRGGAYQ